MARGPLEKDTCRDFVLPRLRAAGWSDDQILTEFPITDGRITAVGGKHRRAKALRADYVLEYRPGLPVAVVEAKREYAIPGKGLQQAKNYARLLDAPFAYATNGAGIVEDDRLTGGETENLPVFPGPAELWARYRDAKGLGDDLAATGTALPFLTAACATSTAPSRSPATTSELPSIVPLARFSAATNVYSSPWRPAPGSRGWDLPPIRPRLL